MPSVLHSRFSTHLSDQLMKRLIVIGRDWWPCQRTKPCQHSHPQCKIGRVCLQWSLWWCLLRICSPIQFLWRHRLCCLLRPEWVRPFERYWRHVNARLREGRVTAMGEMHLVWRSHGFQAVKKAIEGFKSVYTIWYSRYAFTSCNGVFKLAE